MNKVELVGGLVRDPDLKIFDNGGALARFTLGVKGARWNAQTREDEVTQTYVSCQIWGEEGERFAETCQRGDQLYVMGELTQEEVPAAGGKKETKTRVRVLWWRGIRRPARTSGYADPGPSDEPVF